jgi:glycosyltransferase involved in cell wall biosynthesis
VGRSVRVSSIPDEDNPLAERPALPVLLDGAAFIQHRRSGISRYFAELVREFEDLSLGIDAVTPYRYVANVHLAGARRPYHAVPLPRRHRAAVLGRLNGPAARRAAPTEVVHYPLYEPTLLADARRRRSVTTVYDFTFEVLPSLFGDQSAELAVKRSYLEACDLILAISEATASDLRRFHPDLDKPVVVTPLGVGAGFFSASARPVRGFPHRYVLHVGNRAEHKNTDLLLRAFAEVARRDAGLHLVLCGQGLPHEAARLEELGIADRTRVVRLSDRALPAAYRHASAFVFPSHYEGFGLPVVEAMAAGCPTIVSDTPALLEVAGEAADVVGTGDLDSMVATLERMLDDPAHADARRQEGRARAREFSWLRTAQLTASAYYRAAQVDL